MECPNGKGEGQVLRKACKVDGISYPEVMVRCYECNGTGELCDNCCEAIDVCNGEHDDDE